MMCFLDLVRSRDGSMSLTKLAASTFHLLMAATVAAVTVVRLIRYSIDGNSAFDAPLFDLAMWGLYSSVAVGHALADKTGAQVAAFKNRKLDADSGNVGLGK